MSEPLTWCNEKRKLGDLVEWERNPRQITEAQAERLNRSLAEFGQVQTVAVEPDGTLVDGHQRAHGWAAAQKFGPDYEVDVRVASRKLADEEREALVAALHSGAVGQWDWDKLAGFDFDTLTDCGFDADLLAQWNDDAANLALMLKAEEAEPPEAPEAQVDRAEELREKWGVELGDVWQAGEHFVICGDCREPETWRRLLEAAGVKKPILLLTDPPYGVERDEGFEGFEGFGPPIARRQYADDWDSERPDKAVFDLALSMSKNAIIFGGNFFADILPRSAHWIVWDKMQTMPTFGDCELAWTNFARKSVKKFVVQYNGLLGKEKERFHPTQKPIKLFSGIVGAYSDAGDVWCDPFLGSGTTIVAAHQNERRGLGIEKLEKYVAVTLERLSEMGLDARRVT